MMDLWNQANIRYVHPSQRIVRDCTCMWVLYLASFHVHENVHTSLSKGLSQSVTPFLFIYLFSVIRVVHKILHDFWFLVLNITCFMRTCSPLVDIVINNCGLLAVGHRYFIQPHLTSTKTLVSISANFKFWFSFEFSP